MPIANVFSLLTAMMPDEIFLDNSFEVYFNPPSYVLSLVQTKKSRETKLLVSMDQMCKSAKLFVMVQRGNS